MSKPTYCDFCFRNERGISWSNKLRGWSCLGCHLNMPHIQESQPEKEERNKTMPTYDPNAKQPEVQIINGDYPFEIAGVEELISKGAKTRGCNQRKVFLDVYKDTSFSVKIAEVNDILIDSPKCDWKYSVLAKCVGFEVAPGASLDITEEDFVGLRGWGHFAPEPDKVDPKKEWNRIKVFLTDRQKLPPRAPEDNVNFD